MTCIRLFITLAILSIGLAQAAWADGDSHGSRTPPLPHYVQECGACHTAFPAGMLPAASWQRVMGQLSKHFGVDASLDAATQTELLAWLTANAGTGKRGREEPPENRITRSAWFTREHREIGPDTWKRPAIKSAANCAACHTRAPQGDFNEHSVRIPR